MPDLTCAKVVCFNHVKVDKLRSEMPDSGTLSDLAEVLKAVAHPGRLAVMRLIAMEECCVCDLAHTLELPISTASQHLRTLRRAGLLQSRTEGRLVFYSIADDGPAEVLSAILPDHAGQLSEVVSA